MLEVKDPFAKKCNEKKRNKINKKKMFTKQTKHIARAIEREKQNGVQSASSYAHVGMNNNKMHVYRNIPFMIIMMAKKTPKLSTMFQDWRVYASIKMNSKKYHRKMTNEKKKIGSHFFGREIKQKSTV